jgi:hypothetical protein
MKLQQKETSYKEVNKLCKTLYVRQISFYNSLSQ